MTTLHKSIRRETPVQVRQGKHRGRQIIVILVPPNQLAFRIKGTRQEYTVSIEHCYEQALKFHALRDWQQKMLEYKAGQRKRKPRKPIFSI